MSGFKAHSNCGRKAFTLWEWRGGVDHLTKQIRARTCDCEKRKMKNLSTAVRGCEKKKRGMISVPFRGHFNAGEWLRIGKKLRPRFCWCHYAWIYLHVYICIYVYLHMCNTFLRLVMWKRGHWNICKTCVCVCLTLPLATNPTFSWYSEKLRVNSWGSEKDDTKPVECLGENHQWPGQEELEVAFPWRGVSQMPRAQERTAKTRQRWSPSTSTEHFQ